MFLHLTGEEAQVIGAQLSRRAHEHPVEDYASVMLRSASGILGTVEVGNGFPRDGTDGEWKIAGRDGILTMKDGIMKLATANGDEILPSATVPSPYFTAVRDALDRWQRGGEVSLTQPGCSRNQPPGPTASTGYRHLGTKQIHRNACYFVRFRGKADIAE
jgi:predicted dehydrogenase